MAGSDKNAARSIASGSPTQPTQPVSKTESSSVAGQLLSTLKGNAPKPAASHEARLGIMVITILVFAFGFLVYHKMEMQPRMLTEAAIAPTAVTPPDVSEFHPVAGLISLQPQPAVNDPLVNIADLSDVSPFADSEVVLEEPGSEITTRSDTFGSPVEPALPEPVENLSMNHRRPYRLQMRRPSFLISVLQNRLNLNYLKWHSYQKH
jgi:hypothetical protein